MFNTVGHEGYCMHSCFDIFGEHKDVQVWHWCAIIGHCRSLQWEKHGLPLSSNMFGSSSNNRQNRLASLTSSLTRVRHQARKNKTWDMGEVFVLSYYIVQHWSDLSLLSHVQKCGISIPTCAGSTFRSTSVVYPSHHSISHHWCHTSNSMGS